MGHVPLRIHAAGVGDGPNGALDKHHVRERGQGFKLVQRHQRANRSELRDAGDHVAPAQPDQGQQLRTHIGRYVHHDPGVRSQLHVEAQIRDTGCERLTAIILHRVNKFGVHLGLDRSPGGLFHK